MFSMRLPVDPASRTALFTVGGLLLVLALLLLLFRPSGEEARGIGLSRVLQEEERWRQQLWVEGEHINELDLWQIQETLAIRVGLSTSGLKGLIRRAVNAKDAGYRAHGYLLAGNTLKAAEIAGQIAKWHGKQPAAAWSDQAFWLQRRADALWRGTLEDPSPVLQQALALVEQGASAENAGDSAAWRQVIWRELAAWHWARANFRPEDPRAEIQQGLKALEQWLSSQDEAMTPAEQTAVHRLRGRFLLRLAAMEAVPGDSAVWQSAAAAFEQALRTASRAEFPSVWAALQHDLGLAWLELGQFSAAADAFRQAMEIRGGSLNASARVDVRVLERQISERLQTQAFWALALARQGQNEAAMELVTTVHGMTLPEDRGHAWFIAQCARLAVQDLPADRQKALEHYPVDQAQEPGVPSRAELAQP
jgi:tetratricopeptide (TPR) repeat protein